MKVSVYPRGANPRIDRHIQRKSLSFATEQVEVYGTADWVDPNDHGKGIVCRDRLYFGEKTQFVTRATPAEIEKLTKGKLRSALPPAEVGNCRFVAPKVEFNDSLPRLNLTDVVLASRTWDWTMEPATA